MSRHRIFLVLLPALVLVGATAAAATDIPLQNWTVPSTSGKGRSALSDIGGTTTPFIPVTPCRIADTRDGSFPANFGPPSLVGGAVSRTFTIPAGPCTGIPALTSAYSLNFTVVSPPTTPPGGYLTVWPTGAPKPVVSTLNFGAGSILANAAIVPAGTGGGINVFVNFSTDLIIDINGYYTAFMNSGEQFGQVANIGNSGAIVGINISNTNFSSGVWGQAIGTGAVYGVKGSVGASAGGGSAGVFGLAPSNLTGVYGQSTSGVGVLGLSTSLNGVWAQSTNQDGLFAAGGRDGAYVTGAHHGLVGISTGTSTSHYGVYGEASAAGLGSAGVKGIAAGGIQGLVTTSYAPAGIQGEAGGASGVGVTGVSNWVGVRGYQFTTAGVQQQGGILGYNPSGTTYWGVWAAGNVGATGTKPFVEPHPYKAGTVIRYVALEGPEAGTYFRGRGRFVDRKALIEVPETFRVVSDEEGVTVQITPIGRATAVGVTRIGLDSIEVESTRDVEFSFLVQGVRKTFKDWQVVVESGEFMPESPSATIPAYLSEQQKRNLIESGVYNEDGTVNRNTAGRIGWDRIWEARTRGVATK